MAGQLLVIAPRALDANANPYSGAKWYFYATGTLTPQNVYSDFDLATSLGAVVTADSSGKFAPIYLDPTLVYRAVRKSSDGATTLDDIDPVNITITDTAFQTVAAASAFAISSSTFQIVTRAYSDPDYGGGATYQRVSAEPSHEAKFQDASGAWWEIAEKQIHPAMLGARSLAASPGYDSTTAIKNAFEAASILGVPVRGMGETFGVSALSATVTTTLDADNMECKELSPDSATRKSLTFTPYDDQSKLRLGPNFKLDRTGAGLVGNLNDCFGIYSDGIKFVTIAAEVYGQSKGTGIVVDDASRVIFESPYVHEIRYVHTSEVDDAVQGIWCRTCEYVSGTLKVEKLGRVDQTHWERDRYSRGFVTSGCRKVNVQCFIYRVDQGVDVTGSGGNSSITLAGSHIQHCFSSGVKYANVATGNNPLHGVTLEHIGYYAVLNSGPGEVLNNPTGHNLLSGAMIRHVGTSGWARSTDRISSCLRLDRPSLGALYDVWPRNVFITGNYGYSASGSVPVSIYDTDELQTDGSALVESSTGVRVRFSTTGTLPSGLAITSSATVSVTSGSATGTIVSGTLREWQDVAASELATGTRIIDITGSTVTFSRAATGTNASSSVTGTDNFWIIEVPDSNRFKIARSYLDALDGVAITGLSGGSGTHTMTLKSDCDYGIYTNVLNTDATQANEHSNNKFHNMILGSVVTAFRKIESKGRASGAQSVSTATDTDVTYDSGSSDDPYNLLNDATGEWGPAPRDGDFMTDFNGLWAASTTGGEHWTEVQVKPSGGAYAQLPRSRYYASIGTGGAAATAGKPNRFRIKTGDMLKIVARQASGSSINLSVTNGAEAYFGYVDVDG